VNRNKFKDAHNEALKSDVGSADINNPMKNDSFLLELAFRDDIYRTIWADTGVIKHKLV